MVKPKTAAYFSCQETNDVVDFFFQAISTCVKHKALGPNPACQAISCVPPTQGFFSDRTWPKSTSAEEGNGGE